MSVSIAQQVDLLYKQAFGVTKTDTANNKSPSNESIPSPLLIRGDTLWGQADQIPALAAAVPNIVQAYTGASAVQMAADTTTVPISGIYPTWLTNLTYWIPQEFGATYVIKIYVDNPGVGNPTVTGTQIFAAGSGGTGEYYYNYQSGVLNFIGGTIPAALTAGKVLYAVGYRYIGELGVTNLPSNVSLGNLRINDNIIESINSNANIVFAPNGTGQVTTTASFTGSNIYANYAFLANNLTVDNITANTNVSVTGNVSGNFLLASANIVGNNLYANAKVEAVGNIVGNNFISNSTLFVGGNANLGNGFAVFDSSGKKLVIDGNIIPANSNYSLGNASNPWSSLYVSGESIYLGNSLIQSNATANTFAIINPNNATLLLEGNLATATLATVNFSATGNVNGNFVNVNANVLANYINANSNVLSNNVTVNLELAGNTANFSGNVIAPNFSANATVFAVNANISGTTITDYLTVNHNISGNTANFTGNISAANANLGNVVLANFVQTSTVLNGNSNVEIASNGNVTVSVTGLANVVTISNVGVNVVGYVYANGNGTFGALKSNSVTALTGNLQLYSEQSGNSYVELKPFGNGTVDVANFRITSLATPNASTDAATKQYVDDVAQGLNVHDPCYTATGNTLANLTGGGTITYNNGTGGVGANLVLSGTYSKTFTTANCFDGNTTATTSSRILVKNETTAAYNGIYVVTSGTVLTRADDYNSVPEIEAGDFVFVTAGDTYDNTGWVQTSVVATVGTDPIDFVQFSGAGTYQAGAGLTLTGTVFSVNVDNVTTEIGGGNVIVKANAQFTTPNIGAATGTSVDLTGNVLANNLNANSKVTANNVDVTTLVTTGNITVNSNISGNTASFSGNVILPNLTINSALVGNEANFSGNVVLPNLTVNLELAGNTANFTTSVQTPLIKNGNSNIGITANGNIQVAIGGVSNIVNISGTGANVTGSLSVSQELSGNTANFSGNVIVPNLTVNLELAGNTANFTGNVSAANANLGNLATANFVNVALNIVTSNLTVNLDIGGNTANFSGNLGAANANLGNLVTANFVNVASNIVSNNSTVNLQLSGNTANFTGLVDIHDFKASNTANLGSVSNITITGGSNGQYLQTNGSGVVTWATVDTSVIANGNTSVAIPTANGNVNVSVAGNANVLVVTGTGANLNGYLTLTETLSGNIGNFSSNITGQNLFSNVNIAAVGNITGGNIIANSNVDTTNLNANYIYANNTANIGGNLNANANVIVALDLSGNTANFSGNVGFSGANVNVTNWLTVSNTASVGNLRTDNLLYANGVAWDLQQAAGSNTQIQYNDGSNNFGASANFTWDYVGNLLTVGGNANVTDTLITYQEKLTSVLTTHIIYANGSSFLVGSANFTFNESTNQFTVNGNAQFNNANLGNLATANFVNVASNLNVTLELSGNTANFSGNVVVPNLTVNNNIAGNTANFTGNISAANANLGNLVTANFINVASNLIASNVTINLELAGNTANFTGNISAANANLGNLATANFVNISSNLVANNANINLALSGNTANFSGNLLANNITANYKVDIGNTEITWSTLTTSSITANQTLAQIPTSSNFTGVQFLVKGVDSTGSKYSVASVQAVSNGTTVDYAVFGSVGLGSTTGSLVVNLVSSNIELQVTPSSSNSTVWTTQYKLI